MTKRRLLIFILLPAIMLAGCGELAVKDPKVSEYVWSVELPENAVAPPQELIGTIDGLLKKFEGTVSLQLSNFTFPDKLSADELVLTAVAVGLEGGSYIATQVTNKENYVTTYEIPLSLVEQGLSAVFGSAVDPEILKGSRYYRDSGVFAIPTYDLVFSNPELVYTCESAQQKEDSWVLRLSWYRDLSSGYTTQYISVCTTTYQLDSTSDGYRLTAAAEQTRYE